MKIGVTSQNFRTITGHAGKTRRFLVYEPFQGKIREVEASTCRKRWPCTSSAGMIIPWIPWTYSSPQAAEEVSYSVLAARGVQVVATSETGPLKAVVYVVAGTELPPPVPHEH